MKNLVALAAAAAVLALAACASAQITDPGVQTVSLGTGLNSTPMVVAYHPGFDQYYASGGGFPTNDFKVWDSGGTPLQTTTGVNTDNRSTWYNPITDDIESASYNACCSGDANKGHMMIPLDGGGLISGQAVRLNQIGGMHDSQRVPGYNFDNDELLSRNGNDVRIIDNVTGNQVGGFTLTGGPGSYKTYSTGYTGVSGHEIVLAANNGSQAHIFDISGSFIGSSTLPGISNGNSYDGNYANDLMFVWDGNSWEGFQILPAGGGPPPPPPPPAPGASTVSLIVTALGLALLSLGFMVRKSL